LKTEIFLFIFQFLHLIVSKGLEALAFFNWKLFENIVHRIERDKTNTFHTIFGGMLESASRHPHEGMVGIILLFLMPAILPWAAWPIRGDCVPHENGGNLSLSPSKNGWNYFVDCLA